MNPLWILVLVPVVMTLLFIFNDRILIPWIADRKIQKLLKNVRSGKIKPEQHEITIIFDQSGFGIRSGKSPEQLLRTPWHEITKVTAYKRDLLTTDLICVLFFRSDDTSLEIHEEMNNWSNLVSSLPKYLPGCKPLESWLWDVAVPAFETNLTELFSRSTNPAKPQEAK